MNPLVDSLNKRSKIKDYIKNKLDVDAQLYNQIELSTNLDEPKKAKYKKKCPNIVKWKEDILTNFIST